MNKFRIGDKVKWANLFGHVEYGVIIESSFETNRRVKYLIKREDGSYVSEWEENLGRMEDETRRY